MSDLGTSPIPDIAVIGLSHGIHAVQWQQLSNMWRVTRNQINVLPMIRRTQI
jgi:hypothetical protein